MENTKNKSRFRKNRFDSNHIPPPHNLIPPTRNTRTTRPTTIPHSNRLQTRRNLLIVRWRAFSEPNSCTLLERYRRFAAFSSLQTPIPPSARPRDRRSRRVSIAAASALLFAHHKACSPCHAVEEVVWAYSVQSCFPDGQALLLLLLLLSSAAILSRREGVPEDT